MFLLPLLLLLSPLLLLLSPLLLLPRRCGGGCGSGGGGGGVVAAAVVARLWWFVKIFPAMSRTVPQCSVARRNAVWRGVGYCRTAYCRAA